MLIRKGRLIELRVQSFGLEMTLDFVTNEEKL